MILNKKPAHLEVLGTAIKTFMRIKDQFQNNFWDGMPLDNRVSSHLRKLNQITSQLCHEGKPLDTFTSDYRKIPYFNWNPPVQDLLQASCKNDIDDQVEIDDFALVDSLTQNDIDHDLTNVDGNIQMTDSLMPDDGNIRVSGGLALVDVNIQATGNSQTRDFDYLTQNDADHVLSYVDVNIQMTGNLMPVDGNIRVSGDLTLVDANTQATGNGLTRDLDYLTQNDTDHVLSIVNVNIQMTGDLMPVDGNIRVSGGLTLVVVGQTHQGPPPDRDPEPRKAVAKGPKSKVHYFGATDIRLRQVQGLPDASQDLPLASSEDGAGPRPSGKGQTPPGSPRTPCRYPGRSPLSSRSIDSQSKSLSRWLRGADAEKMKVCDKRMKKGAVKETDAIGSDEEIKCDKFGQPSVVANVDRGPYVSNYIWSDESEASTDPAPPPPGT